MPSPATVSGVSASTARVAICRLVHDPAISHPLRPGRRRGFVLRSLLGGDEPLDGSQRIGIQAGRDEPFVQGVGLAGPAVVDALGLVEGGVGPQGSELVPGQVMAGSEAQRGVGCVPARGEMIGAAVLRPERRGCGPGWPVPRTGRGPARGGR